MTIFYISFSLKFQLVKFFPRKHTACWGCCGFFRLLEVVFLRPTTKLSLSLFWKGKERVSWLCLPFLSSFRNPIKCTKENRFILNFLASFKEISSVVSPKIYFKITVPATYYIKMVQNSKFVEGTIF